MCFIFSVTQRIFGQYVLYVMRRYDLRRQSHRRNWGNKTILTQVFLQSTQKKMKQLTNLIMLDKILPAQFHMLYQEWNRDCSVSEYSQSKQCDKRWQTIIKHAEAGMLRDWQVNNGRTPRYDKFWDLVNWYLEEMQAVDDPRHSHSNEDGLVVTNMAVAISTPDLYKKMQGGSHCFRIWRRWNSSPPNIQVSILAKRSFHTLCHELHRQSESQVHGPTA